MSVSIVNDGEIARLRAIEDAAVAFRDANKTFAEWYDVEGVDYGKWQSELHRLGAARRRLALELFELLPGGGPHHPIQEPPGE